MLEGREAAGAGVTRAYIGRGAGVGHQLVARQADAGAGQDMGVEVGQARQHELARGIEVLRAARRRDFRLDRGDQGIADADVPLAAQVLAGIDDLPAADDQVVRIGRAESPGLRLGFLDQSRGGNGRTGRLQERPACHFVHGFSPDGRFS